MSADYQSKNSMGVDKYSSYKPGKNFWSRIGRIMIAGTGFLADSYDLFVINISLLMMKQNNYLVPLDQDTQAKISIMAIVGALTGQFIFGIMGDQFGRKSIFMTTAILTILGTVLQVMAQANRTFTIWQQMMLFRFVMGCGVGGEYPMASTITSEVSETRHRGRNLAAVFSMQGVGRVMCALVLMFSAFVIKDTNWQWRFSILMGAVPMMCAAFFRWLPETEVYQQEVANKIPPRERLRIIAGLVWENRWKLVGTCGSWFILDILFYGNSLFSADVTRAMGTENTLKGKAIANLIIQCMAMPGYIVGIFLIDWFGRKNMQLFGFAGEMIIFGAMAIFQERLKHMKTLFLILYALTFFFDDCGPNLTTFVIPAEIYPTEARSTCHGLSAAFGKAGAAIGGYMFLKVQNWYCPNHFCGKKAPQDLIDRGLRTVFWCCAALGLLGLVWTYVFVTDKPHSSLLTVESVYERDADEVELANKQESKADGQGRAAASRV